jgi:hypothetical protein
LNVEFMFTHCCFYVVLPGPGRWPGRGRNHNSPPC